MHKTLFYRIVIISICLTMTIVSCREDSDDIKSYVYHENFQNFAKANSSLEEQFKAIWTAMNCNYPIWDYEEQQGLNWDKVYDDFLPRFKELDRKYSLQKPVPDSLVYELYDSIFAPLHDGHLYMCLKNIHTEKKIQHKVFSQQYIRNWKDGNLDLCIPTLKYYNSKGDLVEFIQEGYYIFAQFKGGIAYFRLPEFNLIQTFKERNHNKSKDKIYQLWESWFNCIQNLQSTNSLNGIIIDLRTNDGGNELDYQYVLGALHNGNSDNGRAHKFGYHREKSGIGRLDFFKPVPWFLPIYGKEHVVVEAPIVVLVNGHTHSMAEITSLSAKQLKNGYVIGTKTFGAFSPSSEITDSNDSNVKTYYAGDVGDPSLADEEEKDSYFAPFFIKIPSFAFLSLEKQVLEGIGVEPDEIVHLDQNEHSKSGKDNQLDRALEYIRTKQ